MDLRKFFSRFSSTKGVSILLDRGGRKERWGTLGTREGLSLRDLTFSCSNRPFVPWALAAAIHNRSTVQHSLNTKLFSFMVTISCTFSSHRCVWNTELLAIKQNAAKKHCSVWRACINASSVKHIGPLMTVLGLTFRTSTVYRERKNADKFETKRLENTQIVLT